MLRILINLPIKRLVRTGPDRSLTGPRILKMTKDRRPDCGCGPVWSCDFQSWLVQVRSSPGLFPVLGPDFQTLDAHNRTNLPDEFQVLFALSRVSDEGPVGV